ncbi:MAG: hypothetical protein FJ150_06850 [Euryarchaeota archaeon]|nr:hypothetical protein [Euryarchaeota archaeon]
MSPGWVISPGRGSYSLTDNPGYLRYIIDAQHTSRTEGGGYAKALWLVRPFSGDQWILKTVIIFNMRPAAPTNNRNMNFAIRKPDDTGIAGMQRSVGVYDNNPGSNAMQMGAGPNTQTVYFPNSPNPLPLERWYLEVERNKDQVTIRASNDGVDSTFEYVSSYTFPAGSLGNDQKIEIEGDGWYGSNNPPGYADFDYIKVVSNIIPVTIDIKPGSFPNAINPTSKGVIPVAILTNETFDASSVNATTVKFGRNGTEASPVHWAMEDVNHDGYIDMILQFKTLETSIQLGDTVAKLTGKTVNGIPIKGTDSIMTVPK